MKMKFINKILAIVVASATIAATPGFASAGKGDKKFLGKKRAMDHSDNQINDNDQNNQSSDKKVRLWEKEFKFDFGALGLPKKYERLAEIAKRLDQIAGEHPENRLYGLEEILVDLDSVIKTLGDFVQDSKEAKNVAAFVCGLWFNETFYRVFTLKLNQVEPSADRLNKIVELLKKCKNSEDAGPFVLDAALAWFREISKFYIGDGFNRGPWERMSTPEKAYDRHKSKWISEHIEADNANLGDRKKELMAQINAHYSDEQKVNFADEYKRKVYEQLSGIVTSIFELFNSLRENEKDADVEVNMAETQEILEKFAKIVEMDGNWARYMSEDFVGLLLKYKNDCGNQPESTAKFARLLNKFIGKVSFNSETREMILQIVAGSLGENKLLPQFNPNNPMDQATLDAHKEFTKVFVNLVENGWFDDRNDGGELITSIFEKFLYAYSNGVSDDLLKNSNVVPNDRKIVAESMLKLAKKRRDSILF